MRINVRDVGGTRVESLVAQGFVLRVAGLPIDAIHSIRSPAAVAWAEAVFAIERALARDRQQTVDILFEAVQRCSGDSAQETKQRHALLDLKRSVHNTRPPKSVQEAGVVAEGLPAKDRDVVHRWLQSAAEHQRLLAEGRANFAGELDGRRRALRTILKDRSFRCGLLLASPSLDRALDDYLSHEHDGGSRRRERLVENSAMAYLLRAACKTSPFSTLTRVAQGRIDPRGEPSPGTIVYDLQSMEPTTQVRINLAILSRIASALLQHEELRRELRVALRKSVAVEGDRVCYWRRAVTQSDAPGPVTLDVVKETLFHVPATPLLERVLQLLQGGASVHFQEIVEEVTRGSEGQWSAKDVQNYVLHLLRLDLIAAPDLRLQLTSPNPLREFRTSLARQRHPTIRWVAAMLAEIEGLLERYPPASLEGRRNLLSEVRRLVSDCFEALGRTPDVVPQSLVYEDSALPFPRLLIPFDRWRPELSQLAEIHHVLPLFDLHLPSKLAIRGFFVARYGRGSRCRDLLTFATRYLREYYEQFGLAAMARGRLGEDGRLNASPNHFAMSEVTAIDRAQQALADHLSELRSLNDSDCAEVRISAAAVRSVTAQLPPSIYRLYSAAYFCQLVKRDDDFHLVLNQVYGGMTHMFSRFADLLSASGDGSTVAHLKAHLKALGRSDAVFAEVQGGYESNLNLHPPLCDFELLCPGEPSRRPRDEQIRVEDLQVVHDVDEDRLLLRSERLGREVVPLYLGFLVPMALPQLQQVLLQFSPLSFAPLNLWGLVPPPKDKGLGYVHYPRLSYGNIVLQRAQWKVPRSDLPLRAAQDSDADFFLRVARWRTQMRLPECVFVQPDLTVAATTADDNKRSSDAVDIALLAMMRKPLYVDFGNIFTLSLLEKVMRKCPSVVFTEMLPGAADLWLKHNGASYVTELILELCTRTVQSPCTS